ncbi:hypothetical protein RJT34_25905 [Clitoria ternatea]|uniref:Uncharacterized protein n=1 Tax=Clitoria ternatea TaxID=43366 RepID=A0AAN9I7P5_CLITE
MQYSSSEKSKRSPFFIFSNQQPNPKIQKPKDQTAIKTTREQPKEKKGRSCRHRRTDPPCTGHLLRRTGNLHPCTTDRNQGSADRKLTLRLSLSPPLCRSTPTRSRSPPTTAA